MRLGRFVSKQEALQPTRFAFCARDGTKHNPLHDTSYETDENRF